MLAFSPKHGRDGKILVLTSSERSRHQDGCVKNHDNANGTRTQHRRELGDDGVAVDARFFWLQLPPAVLFVHLH